jgi:hypothetical protein
VNRLVDERKEERNYYTQSPSVVHDLLSANGKAMYITLQHENQSYRIIEQKGTKYKVHAMIQAADVEAIFLQKFRERLAERDEFENFAIHLEEEHKKMDGKRQQLKAAIKELTDRIEGISLTLESPSLRPDEREEFLTKRRKAQDRRDAIQRELDVQQPLAKYHKYKDLVESMEKYWDRYPIEERQGVVRLLIKQVVLEPLSCHFIQMRIVWKWLPEDIGIIYRPHPAAPYWTPDEDDKLRLLYPDRPVQEVLEALPRRTWDACSTRACVLGIKRTVVWDVACRSLTIEDLRLMEAHQIKVEDLPPRNVLFVTWSSPCC